MEKKIIAFYDLLLYVIICIPMRIVAIILFIVICIKDTGDWVYKHWYYVLIYATLFSVSLSGKILFRYYEFSSKHGTIYFYYFPFFASWKKYLNNIDIRWNQNAFISEIKDVEIVKLTKEEKKTKVFYKHWFNKYLKINMKYGNSKYVYVGNYSNRQIKQLVSLITKSYY